eukprot:CAMPEP_0171244184 /NCGR_PEP_ID=MMETSP0790-20130122/46699_1 /TAXON_ID=2925 /ORGANISM="Alexandrium catenella, Strain OF101" /LENGTH=260 /DNA_ID=CAMNT_0011711255 /DNA_START=83 /DNA_END=863 /DNA_ORIENTATION=-
MAGMEMGEVAQIFYALVVRAPEPKVVLAAHSSRRGDFEQLMMQQVLPRIERKADAMSSYSWDDLGLSVHVLRDEERDVFFVCMADLRMMRRIPLAFLDAVREDFGGRYAPEQVRSARDYGMDRDFKPALQELMETYSSSDADRLSRLRKRIAETNNQLMEGIGKLLERGDKIDDLLERAEDLQSRSVPFMREAGALRRSSWWKNVRFVAALVCLVILVIFIIGWGRAAYSSNTVEGWRGSGNREAIGAFDLAAGVGKSAS